MGADGPRAENYLIKVAISFLLILLGIQLLPFAKMALVSSSFKSYLEVVGYIGSPGDIAILLGMLIAMRWSKTVVATIAAMFAIGLSIDFFRFSLDWSKEYQREEAINAVCFTFVFLALVGSIYLSRKHT